MTAVLARAYFLGLLGTSVVLLGIGAGLGSLITPKPRRPFSTPVFELRPVGDWRCDQDGTEFICTPGADRDSIGVIAIKLRASTDTLDAYNEHLSQPRRWTDDRGVAYTSEVRALGTRRLAGHDWIASTHFQSELPGFYTLYLATVTAYAGVLVTFSARDSTYAGRSVELEVMIDSLVIYQGS